MDTWTDAQLERMKKGGNKNCKEFLLKHGIDFEKSSIRERYDNPAAELYQQVLKARVEGKPEPTQLPPKKEKPPAASKSSQPMKGFGSSPHPSVTKRENQKKRKKLANIGLGVSSVVALAAWGLSSRRKMKPETS
jgi:hypothetical protein